MKDTQVHVAPITCKLSQLILFTSDCNLEHSNAILRQDESFQVRITVEFGGGGAIALMPLSIPIQVDFFVEPYGLGDKIELGTTSVQTCGGVLVYTPTLAVASPAAVGLVPKSIYQVTAVLRVGAPNWPGLVIGFIEGLALQTYLP